MTEADAIVSTNPSISAIVLAAGRSTRMGRPKALLDLNGEPALGRVLRVLREVPVTQVIVVLNPVQSDVRRAVSLEGVTTAVNVDPDAGQTSSIRIGTQNLSDRADAFLICPVDVPLFEVEDVRALIDGYRARAEGTSIVVPSVGGQRGHPVLFDRSLAPEFRALGDGEPAHAVIRRDRGRVCHVETTNASLVLDLDTPEDYARAVTTLRGGAAPT